MKYPNLRWATMEAVIDKLGGEAGVERFLGDEIPGADPRGPWREQDGVIRFAVTSDGTTGQDWIARLENKRHNIGNYAKSVLLDPGFKPAPAGTVTEVAVLKGLLFGDCERITSKIRAEAARRNLGKPNAEISCLIREKFTDHQIEQMGLWWIIAMHEHINISGCRYPSILGVDRNDIGGHLRAHFERPDDQWNRDDGFAFAVSQFSVGN